MENVNLKRLVFNRKEFNNTVDTEFSQLVTQPDPSFFDVNLATQSDFWILYDKFFYLIPKEGEINSHRYLVETSGEYIDYNPNQEEIEALLAEIAELREENLEVRQQIASVISDFRTQDEVIQRQEAGNA
tara:strand:+ start:1823 stop:2212 length:390 start_codon:yes stop_codon:yes gene_type:complete